MINYVLIDDEEKNNVVLRKLLDQFRPDIHFAGMALCVDEGETLIRKTSPDLVFLDIQMPGGDAFTLLERLQPFAFEVVFVTAFDGYGLRALRLSAADYLLKPVDIGELNAAVQRVSERLRLKHVAGPLRLSLHKVAIPNMEGLAFISIADIVCCNAKGGYTIFCLKSGAEILSTRAIGAYEQVLPADLFARVHQSHIVNLSYVHSYHKGRGGYIEMEDGRMIEVSFRRKAEFLERFGL